MGEILVWEAKSLKREIGEDCGRLRQRENHRARGSEDGEGDKGHVNEGDKKADAERADVATRPIVKRDYARLMTA